MSAKRGERGIPYAAVERVIKSVSTTKDVKRVSDKAVRFAKTMLEDLAREISQQAVALAQYAKRSTVTREDIHLAVKAVLKNF